MFGMRVYKQKLCDVDIFLLRVRQNSSSEFVLNVGNLKEVSTACRNSIKIALNFFVNMNINIIMRK